MTDEELPDFESLALDYLINQQRSLNLAKQDAIEAASTLWTFWHVLRTPNAHGDRVPEEHVTHLTERWAMGESFESLHDIDRNDEDE